MLPRPLRSTLFPYTTLFRSWDRCTGAAGSAPERASGYRRADPGGCSGIGGRARSRPRWRSEEHTSELQSLTNLVCRLLLEKKNTREPNPRDAQRQGEDLGDA